MTKLTISLGQTTPYVGQPEANFAVIREWSAEAALLGSDMVIFPELWSTGGDLANWDRHSTTIRDGIFARVANLASELGIAIGGSTLERNNERTYNTFTLFGKRGEQLAVYRKLHLFALMQEHKWLTAGDTPVLIDAPWGRTGLAICYDIRFAELFRHYAISGAALVLIPAMWPASRSHHWKILLRARAIENQMFIAAVNVTGKIETEVFEGSSSVIDPYGKELLIADNKPALLTTEIDMNEVVTARAQMPVLADMRPDIYSL